MPACKQCQKSFEIWDLDKVFYQKMGVPEPAFCPACRYQRRLAHRNERTMYRRKCDATHKDIVALYPQDSPYKVYEQRYWRSQAWDAREYGRDFDFSRPFFDQMQDLRLVVPRLSLNSLESENSEYTNQSQRNKDCYMLVSCGSSERVFYSMWCHLSKDSMDSYDFVESQLCYEAVGCINSYKVFWSRLCDNCTECYFCFDCRGCTNCFMSTNLRNKSYVWQNEQLNKEEYEKRFSQLRLGSYQTVDQLRKKSQEKWRDARHKFADIRRCQDCTGDVIFDSKNVHHSFHVGKSEDCAYSQDTLEIKDSWDCTEVALDFELNYEVHGVSTSYQGTVLNLCSFMKFSSYCDSCFNAEYLLGCVGVKYAQYCILNKQYTKEEYGQLVPRIIAHMKQTGEWGDYFPIETSVYGYNETTAAEYFPLTKAEAVRRGWKWQENIPVTLGQETISWEEVPDDITDVDESICKEILACQETGKNYKIIKQELEFYKKRNIPLPRLHPDVRHAQRMALRNPRVLYHRQCMCDLKNHDWHTGGVCPHEFETTYAPDRLEKVFCTECYQAEVI